MSATTPRVAAARVSRGRSLGPLVRFSILSAAGVAVVVSAGIVLGLPGAPIAVAAGTIAAAAVISAVFLRRAHPHPRLGGANVVTLVRLVIVAVLAAILLSLTPAPAVVIPLAVVALSLDGVDGYLARRQGLDSRFGAAFDVEVDSAFALVLSLLAVFGPAGPIAIVLGVPRYVFGAATLVAPWLDAPLAPRFSRKAVCVAQLVALIVLQVPWLPFWAALMIVVAAAGLLAWSFTVDIVSAWSARSKARA